MRADNMMPGRKYFYLTGGILAALHFMAVVAVYGAVVWGNSQYATLGWVLLGFIDYPVSLGMGIRSLQIEGNYLWNNGTLPALYFGLLGTAWWFLLGYWICRLGRWARDFGGAVCY